MVKPKAKTVPVNVAGIVMRATPAEAERYQQALNGLRASVGRLGQALIGIAEQWQAKK